MKSTLSWPRLAPRAPMAAACLAFVAATGVAGEASAHETAIGIDLGGATPVGDTPNGLKTGPSFAARLGYRFAFPLVSLTPEIGYGYTRLTGNDPLPPDIDTSRLFFGARLGIGEILVPTVYGHVGYAFVSTSSFEEPAYRDNQYYDAGFALDLRVIPHVALGANVGYSTIRTQPTNIDWVHYGLQAEVHF